MSRGPSRNKSRAVTLMEMLIGLVLLSLIVLGISNIDFFCRHVFLGGDRRAKALNDASYVVEHMSKFIGRAVGDGYNSPVTLNAAPNCLRSVQVWIDNISKTPNGIWDSDDTQIMYCFNTTSHSIIYYSNYTSPAIPGPSEELSRNVVDFMPAVVRNIVDVNISGCWNASISSGPSACGSAVNPRIDFQTRIFMPSVSINST